MATSESLRRHERFYLEDGNVIFQAENVLFNVHRFFLKRGSPVFSDMFSLDSDEGRSDDTPIHLQGTAAVDFERFLSCLYPKKMWEVDDMPFGAWASVLSFAMKWQFDVIRDLAVTHLKDIRTDAPTLAGQIALASKHQLDGWCWEACLKICERGSPLTEEEGAQLGLTKTVRISAIRQKVRSQGSSGGYDNVRIALEDYDKAKKELRDGTEGQYMGAQARRGSRTLRGATVTGGGWGSSTIINDGWGDF
ncbi:uncharacterized protein B0H18DRAFT_885407 [Fomitopsis serialis]|uniref:uncharacterized protein n=1 Tax=Fomitopsis serialis TaxID=139415 RepID=UPI0020086494|nr:uncharacterized protein B0H18DRAFT_885407 [Neoantrodia serialis]KAH9915886.1 hypothetical protein B0H18DRAFT_885407 [Neoantrodia serialis]